MSEDARKAAQQQNNDVLKRVINTPELDTHPVLGDHAVDGKGDHDSGGDPVDSLKTQSLLGLFENRVMSTTNPLTSDLPQNAGAYLLQAQNGPLGGLLQSV